MPQAALWLLGDKWDHCVQEYHPPHYMIRRVPHKRMSDDPVVLPFYVDGIC